VKRGGSVDNSTADGGRGEPPPGGSAMEVDGPGATRSADARPVPGAEAAGTDTAVGGQSQSQSQGQGQDLGGGGAPQGQDLGEGAASASVDTSAAGSLLAAKVRALPLVRGREGAVRVVPESLCCALPWSLRPAAMIVWPAGASRLRCGVALGPDRFPSRLLASHLSQHALTAA
jgi:hypothetical protein